MKLLFLAVQVSAFKYLTSERKWYSEIHYSAVLNQHFLKDHLMFTFQSVNSILFTGIIMFLHLKGESIDYSLHSEKQNS